MLFTARRYTAPEALHAGLVHRVVAVDRLAAEVAALCDEIGKNAPLTITTSKRAVDWLAGRQVLEDLPVSRPSVLAAPTMPRARSLSRKAQAALPAVES